ncbi:RNA polymerase sigma factor [Paenibacillus koleovorans]|uniref:RNA polymerase sigma factor n=1 Tax=Paenibacillus koleovorans TaxID=121608 RepID=UPI000FD6C6B7|nr:RNA polymerase sigma factor [Paenibacillus koleovorans]
MTDRELFEAYRLDVYRLCLSLLANRSDAEDACQDTFVKALRHNREQIDYLKPWLLRIAIHTCRDLLRRRWKEQWLAKLERPSANADLPSDKLAEAKENIDELAALLNQLPDRLRAVIILKYINEMKIQEISEILRIPEGTVKSRLNSGLKRLSKRMLLQQHLNQLQGGERLERSHRTKHSPEC